MPSCIVAPLSLLPKSKEFGDGRDINSFSTLFVYRASTRVCEEYRGVRNDIQKNSSSKRLEDDFSFGYATYEYYEVHGCLYEANRFQSKTVVGSITRKAESNRVLHSEPEKKESTNYRTKPLAGFAKWLHTALKS